MRPGAGCGTWVPAGDELLGDDRRPGPADPRPARVRVAGRPEHRRAAVPVPDLGRGDERGPGPRRRRPGPDPTAGLGPVRTRRAPRDHPRGGQKPCLRIARNLFAALADPPGCIAHRRGALGAGRAGAGRLGRRPAAAGRDRDPDDRGPRRARPDRPWSPRIPGISAVGAAAILAETGDPHRFATGRALVKHAGLAPREKTVRAPSPAGPSSPARAGPGSGSRPGARCGERCRPTPSTPPGTDT